jgi:hypothetical protein
MNRRIALALAIALTLPLTGCVVIDGLMDTAQPSHPSAHASVPPGHRPPPGKCRIWYPDRPPGHQPKPGDCRELERRVPPGASLIRG